MKYISEYHIFDFFKKKGERPVEKEKPIKKKPISSLLTKFDEDKVSNTSRPQKILFYKMYVSTYSELTEVECVLKNNPKIEYLVRSLKSDGSYYYSIWASLPSERYYKEYVPIEIDTTDIDNELNDRNLIEGSSVKFNDKELVLYGRINHVYTAFFALFESYLPREGKYGKVLEIKDPYGKKYYRLPNQVELSSDISDLALSEEFEEEINDYLVDVIESNKFDIKITKKIVDIGIINFFIEIKFKDKMVNNLEATTLFFRNINTLKKRINAINGYTFDIEDLSKEGILIKIFKER